MSGKLMKMALAAVLACMQASVLAEDIDLFAVPPGGSAANVLIVLDNSANWAANNQGWPTDAAAPVGCGNDCNSKQGYYELKAIRTVISGLPTDASGNVAMNIGLMMFNNSSATRDGGYVRFDVRQMTAANRALFIDKLDAIISNFNTESAGSGVQYGAALFDAFKYFGGHTNPDAVSSNPADPPAPPVNPTYSGVPVFGTKFWGSKTADGSKPDASAYSGDEDYEPVDASPCGKNFIVLIGNGFPGTDSNSSSDMGEVLRKLTNPSAPAATITEFPLTTVTPHYSAWADVAPASCYATATQCAEALPANTATTVYQCAKSTSCTGNNKDAVQFATVTYTSSTAAPSGNATGRYADEFADFLSRTDVNEDDGQQEIITYAIDVYRNAPDADQTALMRNVAKYGGGKYFAATNEDALKSAFDDIFSEILSVNSAFASASLPVSVNTQGTYLNQVFIGMFRPEKSPRWFGNLKQYQFRADVDLAGNIVGLTLADKDNKAAINSQNGFVSPCAKSFWTPTDPDSYWADAQSGSCVTPGSKASNSPDGEVVEKGAAAFKLRSVTPADRSVKTCADAACSTGLVSFDTTTGPSATALGIADADKDTLINWVRGLNTDNELTKGTSVMRPSVHGDVVHSRPLAINYGTDAAPQVVVFYGGNDGMLRAVNGNRDGGLPINNVTAMVPGMELWSFVAPEHFDKLQRLKSNVPDVLFTGATYDSADPDPVLKDYYFDGSIGVHRNGGNVWIYPTMRRGGEYVYAFNVSTPTSPSLKWKRGPAELVNVGQTWSEPKVIKVAGYTSTTDTANKLPVIIMGGGYDSCEDQDAAPNTLCGASPKGNRIFVLDADTGAVLQTLGTGIGDGDAILRSIAADITVVDSDGDSYVDMAYAVDTGANVYRIDIGSKTPEDTAAGWRIKRIASLGCSSSASCSRKFLHAPEVVVGASSNAVLVGSGNRERPLLVNKAKDVDNAFFMIKDDPKNATQALITTDNLVSVNPDTGVATDPVSTPNKGWQLVFGSGTHDQEQVVTSAVVVAGVAYFSTHTPPVPSSCDLGKARGYGVNYLDGTSPDGGPLFNVFAGGGLPPSPVAGVVSLNLTNEDGTTKKDAAGNPVTANVPFIIGGGGVSGIDPTLVEVNPSGVRGRVYWYLEQ